MNAYDALDPAFSGRLCMTLFHSGWQIALLVLAARVAEGLFRRPSARKSYALHVTALCVGLAALPVTYAFVEVHEPGDAAPSDRTTARQLTAQDSTAEASATLAAADQINATTRPSSSPAATVQRTAVAWQSLAPWAGAAYLTGVTLML
ncbi:MAG TPA: hypothetical protein VHC19_09455, partial [Pirellulales bacterium]|nr:hypothetical protein [Pirellulales bacterium]